MLRKKRRLALWLSVIVTVMSVLPQSQTAKAAETIFNEKGYEILTSEILKNGAVVKAKTTAGEKLTYSVSNKKVISVDKNGKVTIKKCGTAVVTITSPESTNYKKAVKKITITVKPTVVKSVSVKTAGKGKLSIKWKKNSQADGYIIKYIGNGKTKTKDVKAAKTTSAKLTGLLAGKKYKVSVCAYVKSGSKKLCGDFSKIKNVKVK